MLYGKREFWKVQMTRKQMQKRLQMGKGEVKFKGLCSRPIAKSERIKHRSAEKLADHAVRTRTIAESREEANVSRRREGKGSL
jgi:hypothetical protein